MDLDLVSDFEDEFDVKVVYEEVGSNEEMEVKIKAGTTKYDIVIPSDYMIDKLSQQDLLNEIDFDLLSNLDEVSFIEDATDLYSDSGISDYMVPYFWGTVGIMYNTDSVDEADLTGYDVLFDTNTSYKIGMYDSARDSVAAALLYLGYSVNSNVTSELLEAETALKNGVFEIFGEDNLKGLVIEGNLDMALVYSGDYFDEVYAFEEDEVDINFGYFVPETTNIWVDGFVIPKISENVDLAHEFINFFLNKDIVVANADYVGYAPVIEEAYNTLVEDGYDYDNYDPFPVGTLREMYQFISDDRFERLNEILNAAKVN
jgi:spermidine/putrescine transport system substrate-binding protein/spermidine/putrescine transport system permease protein